MNILSRLRLRTKLGLLLGLSAIALITSIIAAASLMHHRMLDDRVDKLRTVVNVTMGFAESLEKQVTAGRLTHDQALLQLRDAVHTMRFDASSNYILAESYDGIILIHGADPAARGKADRGDGREWPIERRPRARCDQRHGRRRHDLFHRQTRNDEAGAEIILRRPVRTVADDIHRRRLDR
jgi:hypothetical protein